MTRDLLGIAFRRQRLADLAAEHGNRCHNCGRRIGEGGILGSVSPAGNFVLRCGACEAQIEQPGQWKAAFKLACHEAMRQAREAEEARRKQKEEKEAREKQ